MAPAPAVAAAASPPPAGPPAKSKKEQFVELLAEKGVRSTWSWAQAMSAIITDSRYNLLSTIGEKKLVFNEYASSRSREEKIEERDRRRNSQAAFTQMLEGCAQLTSSTVWLDACGILGPSTARSFSAIYNGPF